ncbi:MAG: sugar kinase [Gammaproteobacteria bacterium RIFCSPLOWO2_02_FULL_61_13]|nr:MAG: sugar kinase [Gammaproteobacteria bacterium RIFCSPLOWO2_02_FULL_61_13]
MAALICGSMAFDTIMVFKDRFKAHILPDQIHILNVSFLVPELRREFGGCAGNIAYNLAQLGEKAWPMGTVGHDFGVYSEWLKRVGVPQDYLRVIDTEHTAQAFITTDLDDNQITAFHPGAMNASHTNEVPVNQGIRIGMVSPDGRQGMLDHAAQFVAAEIPFIFDPGQGMPMFDGDDLRRFIDQATWVTVNDYEWQLLRERTGWDAAQVAERVEALVVTRGAEGSQIFAGGRRVDIPPVKAARLADPTGCGDAYRAGLVYGLLKKLDWEITGRIASLLGSIKIEHRGTQNHSFTLADFRNRYRSEFGAAM